MADNPVIDRVGPPRLASIDILRGLVIVIMALDHSRDYFALTSFDPADPETTNAAYFATRWITHFCAPVFVFLAGTSAWLYRRGRKASRGQLSGFLVSRGIWLLFVEAALVTYFWQWGWNPTVFQVIWAIGVAMLALAALIWLPGRLLLVVALAIVFGANLLDAVPVNVQALWTPPLAGDATLFDRVMGVLHTGGFYFVGGHMIVIAYPILAWIGVMALGYAMAPLFTLDRGARDRAFLLIGAGAVLLFVILRGTQIYGDPNGWEVHEGASATTVMDFLSTTKYPPSLHYLLMTLGPAFLVLPLLDRWRGAAAGVFTTFGKVPFFFYVLHIPLIHLMAMGYGLARFDAYIRNPFGGAGPPEGFAPSLPIAYLGWLLALVILYPACRWFADLKRRRRDWWFSYL